MHVDDQEDARAALFVTTDGSALIFIR